MSIPSTGDTSARTHHRYGLDLSILTGIIHSVMIHGGGAGTAGIHLPGTAHTLPIIIPGITTITGIILSMRGVGQPTNTGIMQRYACVIMMEEEMTGEDGMLPCVTVIPETATVMRAVLHEAVKVETGI